MNISRTSLNSIPTAFATVSVGTPEDPLEEKLQAISSAGFQAIELGFTDLISFASKYHKKQIAGNDYGALCSAGAEVQTLCRKYKLKIVMLQPFANFEGWLQGSKERKEAFDRAKGWIKIMQVVGTDMLQVGASDSHNIATSFDDLASDLGQLADLLAEHNFRLCYEPWCWATVCPTWKECWALVQKADRPNIGLCLDTFQIAGGEYGDPCTSSGLIEDRGMQQKLEMNFKASLISLVKDVPPEKIYVLQISDAYKLPVPLEDKEVDGLRPRGRWSYDYRPYPFNGGYLPIIDVTKAVLETGMRNWFSIECSDGGPKGSGEPRRGDKAQFCKGAVESLKKLLDESADPEIQGGKVKAQSWE